MEYRTIFTIKESEKATVELADLEGMKVPVVVKRLQGASPNIYRLLCYAQNPHIPQVFACEQHGNELIVAEEYVDGENLTEYLKKESLSDDVKLDLALQLCEAVEFLHSMEPAVIHRDIKPSNILITGKGILKLIDFDASRQYKDAQNDEDTRLLGTRGYAAPEQFGYSQTDVRSDIYSMGIVFHEMKLTEHKKSAEQWEKIAEKCTSFDPGNRYQCVQELAKQIKKLKSGKRYCVKKLAVSTAVAAVVLGIAATAVLGIRNRQEKEVGEENAQLTVSPVPTVTLAPTSVLSQIPTLSSAPTETPQKTDVAEKLEKVVEDVLAKNYLIDDFYKGLEGNGDYRIYSTHYEGEAVRFTSVALYNLVTDTQHLVPLDCIYNENNVLHVKNSFLQELDESCYQVLIRYIDEATGRSGDMLTYLLIHEGKDIDVNTRILAGNNIDFYYEYNKVIHAIVANNVEGRLIDNGIGRILEDGRVLELDYEFLIRYIEPGKEGEIAVEVKLEDGRRCTLTVNYKTGIPPYAQ